MDEKQKETRYDVAGYAPVTEAVGALLNAFPGLGEGERIAFASLGEREGMAFYAAGGAAIESERRSVTGRVRQVCLFPFTVLIRAAGPSERTRTEIKERLDALGQWLERQPVTADGTRHVLDGYPSIGEGRRFLSFVRRSTAGLDSVSEDHAETWAVDLAARYENIFQI